MNVSFLNNLRVKVYEDNKANGFWDKPRNIGELFFLIISEMVEALEVHRAGGRIAPNLNMFKVEVDVVGFADAFKTYIKDSMADELADSIIRVLDFCGGYNIEIIYLKNPPTYAINNVGEALYESEHLLRRIYDCYVANYATQLISHRVSLFLHSIYAIAEHFSIDLDTHILLKLDYNKTRGKRHGKKY